MEKTPLRLWQRAALWLGRFFFFLWIGVFFYLGHLVYPFFSSMQSITKIPQTYFMISVVNDEAKYTHVSTLPADWTPLDQISKRVRGAIISSEDGKFYEHPGYDIEELTDAINDGIVKKKKLRGASTITQQLVKNLYFQTDRSFWRKTKEMALTLWIEKYVSKDKILESYLNVIEYGEGLYGIKKASRFYFKKLPSELSAREGAFLAMLLPSPKRYSKSFKKRELTEFADRSIRSILFKMLQGGYIGEDEYNESLERHFPWEKYEEATVTSHDIGDL